MTKMEKVLREEIGRLARKEIREALEPMAAELRELKKAVRDLKQGVKDGKAVARPGAQASSPRSVAAVSQAQAPAPRTGTRLSGGLIKRLRKRLGISQDEMATLVNVSKAAVSSWEQNRAKPRSAAREAIIALRDLTPGQVQGALKSLKAEASSSVEGGNLSGVNEEKTEDQ